MFTSWSSYQGSCRDDDSVSSLQAESSLHSLWGDADTHRYLLLVSSLQRLLLSLNSWQYLPSNSECHVCGPGHWCAATAWPGCLRCSPRPPALATRPACTSTSLAGTSAVSSDLHTILCMFTHRQYTALPCVCVETVECLVFVWRAAPPSILALFVISVNIAVDSVGWAAAHRKLETILCDICPSPRQPRVPI